MYIIFLPLNALPDFTNLLTFPKYGELILSSGTGRFNKLQVNKFPKIVGIRI